MKRLFELLGLTALLVAGSSRLAAAQSSIRSDVSVVEGPGIKVGEGTVLHPTIGLETGVVSNVFFEQSDAKMAGLLRLLASLHLTSLSGARIESEASEDGNTSEGDFQFRAGLELAYEEYLSSNDAIQSQRDLGIVAEVRGLVFPQRTWMFAFADDYHREIRPTNFESSDNVVRDINNLRLGVTFQPGGRAITASLGYTNTIDFFERDTQQFANRMQHSLGLRVNWHWLPITTFWGEASVGYFSGLGDDAEARKNSSYPLRLMAGTSTAITTTTTLNAQIGYGRGFYEDGPDFSNVVFGAEAGWRYSPLGRILLAYRYDFADSINANFYRDHMVRIGIDQQVAKINVAADAGLRLRRYEGTLVEGEVDGMMTNTRDDVIFNANIGAQYHIRDWLAATLAYSFVSDQTDFRYAVSSGPNDAGDDPSYVRHMILLGVLSAF